jgi:peptide/nickel transport system substrate-binding protein
MRPLVGVLLVVIVAQLVACAPPAQPGSTPSASAPVAGSDPVARSLVVAVDPEVEGFGPMFFGGKSGPEQLEAMLHRGLALFDDKGVYRPAAAVELPSQDAGTWQVLPDGRSETTWKIRPNARWHDGTPLTADDVAFSWKVAVASDVPYKQRAAANRIETVEVVDPQTALIRWKSFFVGAGRLSGYDLFLLPRHQLEERFLNDREAFVNATYWSSAFIGVGPYRLVGWEPGTSAQVEVADTFYGERPSVKSITFRTIPEVSTGIANILAGEVDVWLGSSLGIEHAQMLKAQYEARGGGQVLVSPRLIFEVRFAPDDPKVADVRMRKALFHALDREAIVRDMYAGLVGVAHSYVMPGTSGFETIDARTTKYPFDLTRAAALLAEMGLRRGSDGLLRDERNEVFSLPYSTTLGNQERESMQAVTANMWKAAGFDVVFQNVTLAASQDPSYRFSTTDLSGLGADFENNAPRIDSRNLKSAQNPRGANVWGYVNSEVDGLLDEWFRTTDRPRQIELEAGIIHRLSEDLPILPINYRVETITASKGLSGVPTRTAGPGATNTWNVETWQRSS